MAETLRLFVSATNDLDAERGIIATTLASLPAHNKVEIRRTPAGGDIYDNIFENIANCDRVFFLMGQDITAPAGQEWYLALDLEREIVPLRKETALTPAGRSFVHGSLVHWDTFRTAGELERLVGRVLVKTLLHPRNRYGLTWVERDLLRQHRFNATERTTAPDPAGAEGGGILLDSGTRTRALVCCWAKTKRTIDPGRDPPAHHPRRPSMLELRHLAVRCRDLEKARTFY